MFKLFLIKHTFHFTKSFHVKLDFSPGHYIYKLNVFDKFNCSVLKQTVFKSHVELTFRQLKRIRQQTNIQHITLNKNHNFHFYTNQKNNHCKQNLLFERINDVVM